MYAKTWAVNTAASIPFQKNSFEDESTGTTVPPEDLSLYTHTQHTHTLIQDINNLHRKRQG